MTKSTSHSVELERGVDTSVLRPDGILPIGGFIMKRSDEGMCIVNSQLLFLP